MTGETRRGYFSDRLTWVLLGAGLAIAPSLDAEELVPSRCSRSSGSSSA